MMERVVLRKWICALLGVATAIAVARAGDANSVADANQAKPAVVQEANSPKIPDANQTKPSPVLDVNIPKVADANQAKVAAVQDANIPQVPDANTVKTAAVAPAVDVNSTNISDPNKTPLLLAKPADSNSVQSADPNTAAAISRAKEWALACSAMVIELNNGVGNVLSGCEVCERDSQRCREVLVKKWGIRSRGELLKALENLDTRGGRARFKSFGKSISDLDDKLYAEFLNDSKIDSQRLHMTKIVRRYYNALGDKSLLGFDYSRYISLCRWAYAAGYLSEAEAWDRIIPTAKILQSKFSSWQELGENYLIGSAFWYYTEMAAAGHSFEEAYWRLLDNPASTWNQLKWNVNLDVLGQIAEPNTVAVKKGSPK